MDADFFQISDQPGDWHKKLDRFQRESDMQTQIDKSEHNTRKEIQLK